MNQTRGVIVWFVADAFRALLQSPGENLFCQFGVSYLELEFTETVVHRGDVCTICPDPPLVYFSSESCVLEVTLVNAPEGVV